MKTPHPPDLSLPAHYPVVHFRSSKTSWARCSCGLTFGVVRTDEGTDRHVAWLQDHRAQLADLRTVAAMMAGAGLTPDDAA